MSIDKLLAERGATHGDFGTHARVAQSIKDAVRVESGWHRLSNEQREAVDMIAHKMGRIVAGNANFADHWDDIAGYATLISNRIPK